MHRVIDTAPTTHGPFQRSIAALVLLSFLTLNTAPAAAAIHEEAKQPIVAVQVRGSAKDESERLMKQLQADLAALQQQLKPSRDLVVKTTRKDKKTGKTITDISIVGTPVAKNVAALQEKILTFVGDLRREEADYLSELAAQEASMRTMNLPPVALERHREFVTEVQKRTSEVLSKVRGLGEERGVLALYDSAGTILKLLRGFEEKRQSFNPRELPFRSAKRTSRIPMEDPAQLLEGLQSKAESAIRAPRTSIDRVDSLLPSYLQAMVERPKFLMNGVALYQKVGIAKKDVSAPMLSAGSMWMAVMPVDTSLAQYLAPTTDVQITESIEALANQLHNNPVEIYQWVRNNVEFLPTYGSVQGSTLTLQKKQGNAFDHYCPVNASCRRLKT